MSLRLVDSYVFESGRERSNIPSDRYAGLLEGIFARNAVELDKESLRRGAQYSFIELCTEALAKRPLLPETDLILFTTASLEFDPAQSGAGAAFMARFGSYEMHAISNEGILGGFTALELARKISMKQDRKICLIALEQSTNPLPVGYEGFVPTENVLALLDLRRGEKTGAGLIAAGVVHEKGLARKIEALCGQHGLSKQNVSLWFADPGRAHALAGALEGCDVVGHDVPPSGAQLLLCVRKMATQETCKPFSLLLIEDVFTRNYGFLLQGEDRP